MFTQKETGVLNDRLGKYWTHWVRGLEDDVTTAAEFIMAPFPEERFHQMVKLLNEAEHKTRTDTYDVETREGQDPNFLMRMQVQYYRLCRQTEAEGGRFLTYPQNQVSSIGDLVALTEQQTAKALDRMIWVVPPNVRAIPNWPGPLLEVEVYGPDFIRCPVWKNSHARQHLEKGRRFKYSAEHGGFKAADTEKYNLTPEEYVDVTMSWPLGVTQHFECYCYALKGESEQTIYIPGEQLRKPTDEEKKATAFFDLAEEIDLTGTTTTIPYSPT